MRTLLVSLAVLTLTLTAARTTVSFDCATLSERESFKVADVVFDGEVIRITRVDQNPQYTFRVDYRLKGFVGREVTILGGHTNCDATFAPNTIYRVYARYYNGKLTSGVCSGNKVLRTKK